MLRNFFTKIQAFWSTSFGTVFYNSLKRHGRFIEIKWNKYFIFNDFTINFFHYARVVWKVNGKLKITLYFWNRPYLLLLLFFWNLLIIRWAPISQNKRSFLFCNYIHIFTPVIFSNCGIDISESEARGDNEQFEI